MDIQLLIPIGIYMVGMLLIGYAAYKRTSNLSDYMLGGRSVGPAVTALSAGASDMSGWLLMGLPGAMYVQGLSASWIAIGLTIGAFLNWLYVAPRLRVYTEIANNSMTIPSFLENRFGDRSNLLRLTSGLVIIVFFTFYVSSGIVSGGVLFETSFGVDYKVGLWIIAGVVVAYTLFGGFLAVSWTDFVQGLIMVSALIVVPVVTIMKIGGIGPVFTEMNTMNPDLFNIFTGTSVLGIISLMAWGLGYFGQPHIIVRFMAITSVKEIKKARNIGMSWMIFSVGGAMLTGFLGLAYYSQQQGELADPETVFITLSEILFHPFISGFLLAALLAAVMSTISSQLLVTSSSLTEDIYKTFFRRSASDKELMLISRGAVLVVAVLAVGLALNNNSTILSLVGYAWAGFGAAFGPVILMSLYWKRMNKWGALAGIIGGAVTVIVWASIPSLAGLLYEIIPGFFVSTVAVWAVSLMTPAPSAQLTRSYEKYEETA
ncbi:sodium/proline symporter PutP [Domibacillus sp. DTU_2020_1001157_1_SI_ALB_TIR_016]|uniref:sodium/proline symporter PutP n=1 Tax=Domibacillus sp. DTU_2020_1001157_1_SI_ALB_TIR_016 TaxID=3077789 RepID=UPI0028F077A5|nr:sodium/proline symporter PutP [Domibacillus sp. DTU_2020_1001157_1_SI_ALB_TIR_016]WNS81004.1 sodium/proline symporter PutP [Domibacillus sp. DTU_2020_1001157_1_SI_ALB_TIR_016]